MDINTLTSGHPGAHTAAFCGGITCTMLTAFSFIEKLTPIFQSISAFIAMLTGILSVAWYIHMFANARKDKK